MENNLIIDHVLKKIGFVNQQFYRLLLIVGPAESGQEYIINHVSKKIAAPVVNINLDVSERLLELPEKQRPLNVSKILNEIIKSETNKTFIFKNIELLFDAALETDPLRLFKTISRNKTVIVVWNGFIKDEFLIYAQPGHPEYRKYPTHDVNIINLQASAEKFEGVI